MISVEILQLNCDHILDRTCQKSTVKLFLVYLRKRFMNYTYVENVNEK